MIPPIMKLFNEIELIDLAIYTDKALILTDFHIGYEEALNKQGLMVPRFQFEEIIKRLEKIFLRLKGQKIERIIVNGDLKHEFVTISEQEWRNVLKLLDYFGRHCDEIILIEGNHDTILGPIARKRNVKVVGHYIIDPSARKALKSEETIQKSSINNNTKQSLKTIKTKKSIENTKNNSKNKILVIHGDKIPDKTILEGAPTIIIGHEHPAVSIRDGARTELFKAYLIGKWQGKNIIAQPSFNMVTEGTDMLREEVLSPFLKGNLGKFEAIIVADKLYRFGKLKNLG